MSQVFVKNSSEKYYADQLLHQEGALVARASGDGSIAPMPHTVSLAVNNSCFLRCKHCDVGSAKRNPEKKNFFYLRTTGDDSRSRELPMSRFKELVDELAPHGGVVRPAFLEPLLRNDLFELARYTKDKKLSFSIQTNGVLLHRLYREVVDSGVTMLRVSLDGPPEIHDSIRGVPGTFSKIVKGLRKLIRYRDSQGQVVPNIGLSFAISGENYRHIIAFMKCLEQEGLLEHVFIAFSLLRFVTPQEAENQNAIDIDLYPMTESSLSFSGVDKVNPEALADELGQLVLQYPRDRYQYHFFPSELSRKNLNLWFTTDDLFFAPEVMCLVPWAHCHIMYNGDVVFNGRCCCPPLGNIMDSSLEDIWNGKKARKFRKQLLDLGNFPACNRCCRKLPGTLLD